MREGEGRNDKETKEGALAKRAQELTQRDIVWVAPSTERCSDAGRDPRHKQKDERVKERQAPRAKLSGSRTEHKANESEQSEPCRGGNHEKRGAKGHRSCRLGALNDPQRSILILFDEYLDRTLGEIYEGFGFAKFFTGYTRTVCYGCLLCWIEQWNEYFFRIVGFEVLDDRTSAVPFDLHLYRERIEAHGKVVGVDFFIFDGQTQNAATDNTFDIFRQMVCDADGSIF